MTRWLWVSIILTVLVTAGTVYVYFDPEFNALLPDPVPTHWNIHGQTDKWTPKAEVLPYFLIGPAAMGLLCLLTPLLPWLSPRQFSVEPFRKVYDYVMGLVVVLFAYLQGVILLASFEARGALINWLVGGIFVFFALLGNVLGQIRRNFWMGVRTPWTLASETVWNNTHRLAAWLFVGVGISGAVAVVIGVPLWICFAGIIIAALVPIFYSLWLYKRLEHEGKLDRSDLSAPATVGSDASGQR